MFFSMALRKKWSPADVLTKNEIQKYDSKHESRSKKEVVIDYFDGFLDIQLISRPIALPRAVEIKV